MASDKVSFSDVGAIAQAMKFQVRTGLGWDDLPPQAKEAIDQILSSVARTVASGQGAHWDGIMAYADSAKPRTDDPDPMRSQVEGRPIVKPDELAESVRRLAAERLARNLGERG